MSCSSKGWCGIVRFLRPKAIVFNLSRGTLYPCVAGIAALLCGCNLLGKMAEGTLFPRPGPATMPLWFGRDGNYIGGVQRPAKEWP
jgi:hypothetical protein